VMCLWHDYGSWRKRLRWRKCCGGDRADQQQPLEALKVYSSMALKTFCIWSTLGQVSGMPWGQLTCWNFLGEKTCFSVDRLARRDRQRE
jgi:hypothetical protein